MIGFVKETSGENDTGNLEVLHCKDSRLFIFLGVFLFVCFWFFSFLLLESQTSNSQQSDCAGFNYENI